MEFRPCIDIHNGKVKQIVGESLRDEEDFASENFVASQDAAFFAGLYQRKNIKNGHVILLNHKSSPYYEETKRQALSALRAYPFGLQAGGGITPENAGEFLNAGASHVIVTSYVFGNGQIYYENLSRLVKEVGRENLVLDLSCRKKGQDYYIVTDRWQNYTHVKLKKEILAELSAFCDEFLIHAVDAEGKSSGIETELAAMLGEFKMIPVTYAGGIHSMEDLAILRKLGQGRVHATIGSALEIFGGTMKLDEVLAFMKEA